MKTHTCPIDVVDYAVGVAERALDLVGAEVSTADQSSLRRIAEDWLETLTAEAKDLDEREMRRVLDSGKAHLTREYR